jgi:hypothetical protein
VAHRDHGCATICRRLVPAPEQYSHAIQVDRPQLLKKRQDIIQKWSSVMMQ